jgi:hypothetical protein
MTRPKKLQFHLSTLVILTLVSGAMMLVNQTRDDTEMLNQPAESARLTAEQNGIVKPHVVWFKRSGWPIASHAMYVDGRLVNPLETYTAVALNGLFAVVLFVAVLIGFEHLLRRWQRPQLRGAQAELQN